MRKVQQVALAVQGVVCGAGVTYICACKWHSI